MAVLQLFMIPTNENRFIKYDTTADCFNEHRKISSTFMQQHVCSFSELFAKNPEEISCGLFRQNA